MRMKEIIMDQIKPGSLDFKGHQGDSDIGRLLATFRGEKTDRVPNFEILIEDKHVEKLLGRYAGNTLALGGDPAKGIEESEGSRPMHAKDYVELCQKIGQDVIVVEALWTPFKKWKNGKLVLAGDRSIKTRKDFESLVMPNSEDIETKMRYLREYREAVKGTRIGVSILLGALFQTAYEFLFNMADFMLLVYDDRDFVEDILDISTSYWVEFSRAAICEGIDFLFLADDIAYKNGLFVRPEDFKPLWLPRLKRILEPILNARVPVMFHSDGKLDAIMDDLIDAGINCLNPMDPYSVDYRDYKIRYGRRIALSGNIDIEYPLVRGTPQDVRKDVLAHMETLKPGGGWVAGSSHSIVNYIPHENFIAMINAIHEYGKY